MMRRDALPFEKMVFVCINERDPEGRPCCHAGGGVALHGKLKAAIANRGLRDRIRVSKSGCLDRCEEGPNVMVFPEGLWYSGVSEADLDGIVEEIVALLAPD